MVNYFVVHSPVAGQIWVMGVRMEGELSVGLVKCAVVDCDLPIYAIGMSMGFLVLGEIEGVRVFSIRGLVKGKRKGRLEVGKRGVLNGVVIPASSAGFESAAEGKAGENQAPGKFWAILSVFSDVVYVFRIDSSERFVYPNYCLFTSLFVRDARTSRFCICEGC